MQDEIDVVAGLEDAVADRFLVPPKSVSVPLKFQRQGIKYEDLSEDEKDQWDAIEWDDQGNVPTEVAAEAINRIIDVFPSHQQAQVRAQLSSCLEGIITQTLLPRASGKGRAMAAEILVVTPAIRALIRDDKVHQIYGVMQAGQEKLGMQTANQSLASLYMKRLITLDTALAASSMRDELQDMISRGVGVVPGAGLGRRS